ncbi:hypothetical protein Patl1_29218 [Pistacia atlantica]|uniref:Uncharacterized protein n=1 Tax=Pistacia atlantica TaxID=434234 RepID=A0ACC1BGR9_9ROSI|nr:hypothetical protein Patl1_29218 [Pistacia atlantica]
MASINAFQVMQVPSRSISLPARLLHPTSLKIEEEFNKLKTWDSSDSSVTTTPSRSFKSIQTGLIRLPELYNCVEELVHSPLTQQALNNQQHVELVEEALDRSIGLLDACSNARELILSMKEQVQDLQSALRRRGGDYSIIEANIQAYINFRKKSKKDIAKCIRTLQRIEITTQNLHSTKADHQHLFFVINVLKESSAITISIFKSLLFFLSMPVSKTKSSGWSILISKLIPAEKGHKVFNEVGCVDMALYSLHEQIRRNNGKVDVQMALKKLETVDGSIKGLERGLDCLFRGLIQNRVSLLNALAP